MKAITLYPQEDNSELPIVFPRFTGNTNFLYISFRNQHYDNKFNKFSYCRQVIIVLTQLEGSGGFSIAHRLTHRLANSGNLHDWGPPDTQHCPQIDTQVEGLHSPRLIT